VGHVSGLYRADRGLKERIGSQPRRHLLGVDRTVLRVEKILNSGSKDAARLQTALAATVGGPADPRTVPSCEDVVDDFGPRLYRRVGAGRQSFTEGQLDSTVALVPL
jgi:hypothetical protein